MTEAKLSIPADFCVVAEPVHGTLPARLAARLVIQGECWVWTGAASPAGYGRIAAAGSGLKSTHRAAYEIAKGPIPPGMMIDHLCRNTRCANPDHLEVVTPQENVRRGKTVALRGPKPPRCKRGHSFAERGRLNRAGHIICRECDRLRQLARRASAR